MAGTKSGWDTFLENPEVQKAIDAVSNALGGLKRQPNAELKNHELSADEQKDYSRLLEISKTRKEEDKDLVYATAGIIGGVTGAVLGVPLPVFGPISGGMTGAALASSAAKDFMEEDYEKLKLYEKYTRKDLYEKGNLPEKEHYELLKKSEENRRLEDKELGNNIGRKIGAVVGEKEDLQTQAVQASYGQAGELSVSFLRKQSKTMPILIRHVKELTGEVGDAFDKAGKNIPKHQREAEGALQGFIQSFEEWKCENHTIQFPIAGDMSQCKPKQNVR